ncbi:MAG: hypothetical protein EVA21_05730 [Alphaproteobacteria bacterium]|nr:MAG: hypothetical protein EVA21_05730 [Alphaproteobacteria bacterium]
MYRIYFYLFVSINFLAMTCLFIVTFVNIIFIREEFVEIPEIKSSNNENFIIPNEVKNNDYNFKILNHGNDNISENIDSKNIVDKKNKDNIDKNLLDKKNNSEKVIKKFIVQLGVFKNKKNADKQLLIVNKHKAPQFKEVEIKLFKTKNKNNSLYTIETKAITKINAINLCNVFKNKKINCLIKIRK